MKNTPTLIAACALLALTWTGCRKADRIEISTANTSVRTVPSGTAAQTAQSVMIELFALPTWENNQLIAYIDITLAAQSFVLNRQYPVNGKYSFSLLDSKGKSRISNLQYSYNEGPWTPLPYTIINGCNDPVTVLSTFFIPFQSFGTAQGYLMHYSPIGTILSADESPNNDNACGNADIAKIGLTLPLPLEYGNFLRINGIIKGNDVFGEFFIDFVVCRTSDGNIVLCE